MATGGSEGGRLRGKVGPVLAWLAATAVAPAAAAPRPVPECRTAPVRSDRLTDLGARGELVLASGTRAVLSGLNWPEEAGAATAWLLGKRDKALALTARGEPDRWGRIRVDAVVEGEAVDLAGGLVADGLAMVDAGEGDSLCRPGLLALEETARRGGLGLWRTASPEARDGAGLRARADRFVVAQGRLVSVGERATRTYLDFVPRGQDGLTVTVSKRTWRRLQERGLSAASLRGRLVRVRGIVTIGRGPVIDLASADMIEVLDEERALRR
ncbi:DNA-binding protein [Methylobacterium sp. Leaf399]|uniref:thermonuclease family protein n=1 Tax=Methylobacterium sp. Leaf399 TaxID=1736364 RepID=UPI0006FBA145|nr:DNA-binding protein [Methylobacterium sp. Leaf399]